MLKVKVLPSGLSILALAMACVLAADTSSAQVPEATTYQIRNVKYGELLRPKNANSAEGTPLVLYPAQPWKCMTWQLTPEGDSPAFRVRNLFTSKTFHAEVGVESSASQQQSRVTQMRFPKDGSPAPGWRFVRQDDGSYEIVDAKSGNAITAVKDDDASEVHIVTAPWVNQDNQKWRLEKIDPKDLTM